MRSGSKVAWLLCFAWCAWLTAGQNLLRPILGLWTPDLALVLIAGLVLRSGRRASIGLVYCLVAARLGTSLEPPAALAAGGWLAFLLARGVAAMMDRDQVPARAGAAFGAALILGVWLALASAARLGGGPVLPEQPVLWELLLQAVIGAAATGICAVFLGSLFVHLPGLAPLRRQP